MQRCLLLCVALVVAVGSPGCSKARNLGTHCRNSDDCGSLSCGWELKPPKEPVLGAEIRPKETALAQVCTLACKTSEDCVSEFGDSQCLSGLCVRECRQDLDCPAQTYCINHQYCGR